MSSLNFQAACLAELRAQADEEMDEEEMEDDDEEDDEEDEEDEYNNDEEMTDVHDLGDRSLVIPRIFDFSFHRSFYRVFVSSICLLASFWSSMFSDRSSNCELSMTCISYYLYLVTYVPYYIETLLSRFKKLTIAFNI